MAEDKRELILARLDAVLNATVDNSFRNTTEINDEKLPAAVLLDADEQIAQNKDIAGRSRPANGPVVLELRPEVILVVRERAAKVGCALNVQRAKMIKAVMTDSELNGLCTAIRYEGFTTALGIGRSMESQGRLQFVFEYVLRIDKL